MTGGTKREVTPRQLLDLFHFIAKSPDACDYCKKVIIWLILQTRYLSRPVLCRITENIQEIFTGIDHMKSTGCSTRIHDYCQERNLDLYISQTHDENRVWIWAGYRDEEYIALTRQSRITEIVFDKKWVDHILLK